MARTGAFNDGTRAAKDLETALKSKPDEFVICRDMKHAWAVENNFHVYEQAQERTGRRLMHIARDLVCMRCATIRHEIYLMHKGRGLEKISQSYEYPADYQIPGVPRGVKPSWIIQQEQYRRSMEEAAHAAAGEHDKAD